MVKRVAIIGSGVAGLAAVRALLANTNFEVSLYERNSDIGGVWYYPPDKPHTNTPMYDWLETNLTKHIMQFKDFPFPESVEEFPKRYQVWEYLKCYFEEFVEKERVNVHLDSKVKNIKKVGSVWEITANDVCEVFDFVVIANGHFDIPYIPSDLSGLDEWIAEDPDSIIHSKEFISSEFYRGKTVLVVGNGSSGSDIANQVSSVAHIVYHSVRDIAKTNWEENKVVNAVSVIKKMDVKRSRCVILENGKHIENIDLIIWATGFLYDVPFLNSYRKELFCGHDKGSSRLFKLWKQTCFYDDPTLAFSLLCKNVVPFPVSELQACLIAKVFTGALKVPKVIESTEEPTGKDYHSLLTPKDIEYCQEVQKLLDLHGGRVDRFQPIRWEGDIVKLRFKSAEMKQERTKTLVKRAMDLRTKQKSYTF